MENLDEAPRQLLSQVSKWKESVTDKGLFMPGRVVEFRIA